MTYAESLFARATGQAVKAAPGRQLRAGGPADHWTPASIDHADAQARLYTQLSWIQIATEIKASYVATTPLWVERRTAGGTERLPQHPLEALLDRPNPDTSRFEFLRDTSAWLDVTGECYWWRNRAAPGAPDQELWIQPTSAMEPVPDGYGGIAFYWYDPGDGPRIRLESWEVIYFKTFNPRSRYRGLSAVQALALGAMADVAAQRHNLSYYDKDNAKPGGILAFADDIEEGAWRRLDQDINDQTGGTKNRRIMKLRNVGAGGVQWIMTHIPQRDQQFLEGRTFTKEEIFGRIAPGLASVLAVNATEANATAGMNTFLNMAVYPRTVAVGQKLTATMLEPGELATFADVRGSDTDIEIREQERAERVMTVDEVRQKYYQMGPLGGERGGMLVNAAQTPQPAAAPDPAAALALAGKALDRRRWRDKALKALAAGRAADVAFTPEYLADDEAMPIRAALRQAQTADDVARATGEEG